MEVEDINSKIENWSKQIDWITKKFKEAFEALTKEQLNWKPNIQTWSIAQNMEHLIVINESYFPILKSLRGGTYKTPFLGRLGFIPKFMGEIMLQSVQPDRKKKTQTFEIWEPTSDENITDILKKLKRIRKN